jgi:hypothetical protein
VQIAGSVHMQNMVTVEGKSVTPACGRSHNVAQTGDLGG